jgi:hypothetical protein
VIFQALSHTTRIGEEKMAFDEGLAQRVREVLVDTPGLIEKKMFGGIGFLLDGNMACGVHGDQLIIRVGPDNYEDALQTSHATPFDLTGRAMKGWIFVELGGFEADEDLKRWVLEGIDFARSLPPK